MFGINDIFIQIILNSLIVTPFIIVMLVLHAFRKRELLYLKEFIWIMLILKLLFPIDVSFLGMLFQNNASSPNKTIHYHEYYEPNAEYMSQKSQIKTIAPKGTARSKITQSITGAVEQYKSFDNTLIFPVLWLLGIIFILIITLVRYFIFAGTIARTRQATDSTVLSLIEDCKEELGVHIPVVTIISDTIGSPTLYGFIRPRLLMPGTFVDEMSREELKYIILHELIHLKRKDIILNWLAAFAKIANWFNPLVWIGLRAFRHEREQLCDAKVVQQVSPEKAKFYGNTLIKALTCTINLKNMPSIIGIVEEKKQMKNRIKHLATGQIRNRVIITVLSVILAISTGVILFQRLSHVSINKNPKLSSDITLVTLDDKTVQYFGKGLPGRDKYAEIINKINEGYTPKVIYVDLCIDGYKEEEKDAKLYETVANSENIIFCAIPLTDELAINDFHKTQQVKNLGKPSFKKSNGAIFPLPEILQNGGILGFSTITMNRHGEPVKSETLYKIKDAFYASSFIQAVALYNDYSLADIHYTQNMVKIGDSFEIPVDGTGLMKIQYNKKITVISAKDLLTGKIDAGLLDGRIVCIGANAVGWGTFYPLPGNPKVDSTIIAAHIMQTVIDSNQKNRQ